MGRAVKKTTIDLDLALFRRLKQYALDTDRTIREIVTEALQEKLSAGTGGPGPHQPAWMRGFGALRRLHAETRRIQAGIDDAFEVVEPEDRA